MHAITPRLRFLKTISRGSEIRTHTSPLGERTVFKTVSGTLYSLWEPLYKVALNGIEPLSLESKSSVLSHYTWQGNKKERVVRIELTSKAWKAIIITIILYPHIPVSPDLSPYPVLFNFGRLRSHRRTSQLSREQESNLQFTARARGRGRFRMAVTSSFGSRATSRLYIYQ